MTLTVVEIGALVLAAYALGAVSAAAYIELRRPVVLFKRWARCESPVCQHRLFVHQAPTRRELERPPSRCPECLLREAGPVLDELP